MSVRDGLVYDEDDYVPPGYAPPKRGGGRTRSLVALAVVGVIVGTFVVLFLLRSRERARFVQVERARSAQNAALGANRAGAERTMGAMPGPPGNWDRMIGVWSRIPEPGERGRPIRFEIRKDRTAAMRYIDDSGELATREWGDVIIEEDRDGITLGMQGGPGDSGRKDYRFRFLLDGSILLEDREMGDLQFQPGR
jgi:hypothetical protein